jgi:hypothetical protein
MWYTKFFLKKKKIKKTKKKHNSNPARKPYPEHVNVSSAVGHEGRMVWLPGAARSPYQ